MSYISREGGDVKIGVEKLPGRKKPSLCVWCRGFHGQENMLVPVASFKDDASAQFFMEAVERMIPVKAVQDGE